ncbi:mucin-12 [Episyrphus balteatus]|uniref:mucin-12 n=1 Tax=Episyrphus balteatus TaxID=286459 RepID=UPI0024858294|nr:mucin-12 [Episyrphus balteatus]
MAKDTAQSRIPRLDGVTKIPLPGSIRSPAIQIRRPTSFTGLRPPSLAMTSLKKSLSGDRISEAASIMGKRTATAVRKFLTKPEKSAPHIETMTRKFTPPAPIPGTKMMMSRIKTPSESIPITPTQKLTRSDTFVREDGESEVIRMAQSSIVVQSSATASSPMIDLYMTHSLDGSSAKAALGDTMTVDSGGQYLCRTQTLDKSNSGTPRPSDITVSLHRSRNLNSTQTLEKALGMTFRHGTPTSCSMKLDETRFRTHNMDASSLTKDLTRTIYSPNDEDFSSRKDGTVTIDKCSNLIDLQSCENLLDIDISSLDPDSTLRPQDSDDSYKNLVNITMEDTLPLAPDKNNMKLVLNSTMNTERLIDLTTTNATMTVSPLARHQLMNITRDLMGSPCDGNLKNNTNLLYMSRREDNGQSPNSEPMEVDRGSQELLLDNPPSQALQELKHHKPRFSFGLDLTESTLDCSIELCDVSLSSTIQSAIGTAAGTPPLKKQNSFEMDESLGILTPDQMKEFLDSTTTTTNLDLPLGMNPKMAFHQMRIDQTPSPEDLPLDPVEVKTDVEHVVIEMTKTHQQQQQSNTNTYNEISQTDTESKTDQMTKSNVSKISTSFITSVTSVTSLDTGYQGDGEMSRPASRGAGDHSPSNGPHRKPAQVSRQPSFNHNHPNIPIRRQDPMTDSDFFTESDADDVFHRGDRRAQVIDGQLYGPMLQPSASVFISEQPEQMDDSCMESSGIFTDVENRCDEDISQMRGGDIDMSPDDGSTDTVKSNKNTSSDPEKSSQQQQQQQQQTPPQPVIESEFRSASPLSQGQWNNMLTDSQTSSTIQSSFSSSDRISMTTDYNPTGNSKRNNSSCAVSETNKSSVASSNEALCSDTTTKASAADRSTGASDLTIHTTVKKVSPPRKHASLSSLCSSSCSSVVTKNDTKNSNCRSTANSTISGERQNHQQQQLGSAKSNASVFNKSNSNVVGGKNGCEMPVRANTTAITTTKQRFPLGANNNQHHQQENKNPGGSGLSVGSSRNGSTAGISILTGGGGSVSGSGSPTLRKISPNKWDAVMSKIAVNKMQVKKNYSEVKSKVSTGVLRRSPPGGVANGVNSASASKVSTPLQDNSPVVGNSNCSSGLASPHTKRITQGAAKRGRSYSKDSQQSSQSDLSLSSGSPKLLAKTPSRAAKKRDVRNLSISPTDLGPPPKAQQTTNGSTRTKTTPATLSQKRSSPNNNNNNNAQQQQQQNLSTPIGSNTPTSVASAAASATATPTTATTPSALNSTINTLKGSPPAKKVISRRSTTTEQKVLHSKTPLKDHNRLVSQQNSNNTTTTKTPNGGVGSGKSGSGNAGSGIVSTSTPLLTATEKALLRTSNNTHTPPSPILNNLINNKQQPNGKCMVGRIGTPPTSQGGHIVTSGPTTIKKTQKDKPKILVEEELQEEEFEDLVEVEDQVHQLQKNINNNNTNNKKLLQQRHSYNGGEIVDYHHLPEFQFQGKGIAALGVLLQYLVYDLDAFSCPTYKVECENAKQKLNRTLHLLDEAKSSCHELRDQIFDKEAYYTKREQELQDLHRCELEKVETNLKESQNKAKEHIASLESQLAAKDVAHKRALEEFQSAADIKYEKLYAELLSTQQKDEALRQRLTEANRIEDQLKEQLHDLENNYTERCQLATQRERELVEKINGLSKQLENLKSSTENRAQELENKLNLSQDEISVLRLSRSFTDHSSSSAQSCSPRNSGGAALEIQRLQSEAESLRCVLEIKQKEISKLTKQNQELMRDADEAQVLMGKVSTLESRCEMLQSETELKAEKEKEMREKLDELTKAYNHEAVVRKRLSFDKEALQWQLKQRSEQLQIVESKFHEHLSSSKMSIYSTDATINQEQSHNSSLLSLNRTNGSERIQFQMDDISPPSSPIIKGVIEKNESVSWVLEMDDETPEVAASKMVKRAGSFRSAEKSPQTNNTARRQLSVSATCGGLMAGGPNPLSQSMSATSVIRQHSNDAAEFLGRVHSRIRSKSVSVKSEPKKVIRQNSSGSCRSRNNGDASSAAWKDPLCASSPYTRNNIRQRPSSSSSQQRSTHLITCDTSTLNTGEKLEMRSLPSHPSVHDLKKLKKCQEIQESAGEAMVSGTNSEDEGCSASSDEAVSTSSSNGTSSSSLHHHKQHMSIEEALLLDKIHSLNGTPMEVSWSDDVFASESTV